MVRVTGCTVVRLAGGIEESKTQQIRGACKEHTRVERMTDVKGYRTWIAS